MATTRIRKTFKYPSDDEASQTSHDELDEQGQENLISDLQAQSQSSNSIYTLIFTILPLTLTPIFAYYLLFASAVSTNIRLLCLLSLTSLVASAFVMFFMSTIGLDDMTVNGARERLDRRQRQARRRNFTSSGETATTNEPTLIAFARRIMDKLDDVRLDLDTEGPLLKVLPVLNGIMGGLLAITAWILKGASVKKAGSEFMWLFLLLPGVMVGITTVARRSMIEEERGLKGLKGLRYGYKGA